jgi:protein O-mannosyl-transferase
MTSLEHRAEPDAATFNGRTWAFLALALALAVLPYLATLSFGFVYDDRLAIEENPYLRVWPGLGRLFFSDIWSLSGLGTQSNYYRPMFLLAYVGVFRIAGAAPWAFHLLNVLFHAAATGMVFILTLRFWNKASTAGIAAILFAIHPVHVEPVAWIAALSELAYTLFVLAAVYLYAERRLSRWIPIAALSCYAMSLLWKESAIAFVPLAVLYDVLVLKRWRWERWVTLVGVTVLYLVLRSLAIGGFAPSVLYPGLSLATQVMTATSNIGFYVWKLLVPYPLSAFYRPEFVSAINLKVVVTLLLVVLSLWKLRDKAAWAACWIAVSLFPVLFVSRIAVPLADRDLYLSSVGFVWLAAACIDRLGRKPSMAIVASLVLGYGALTVRRLPDWRDDLALYEQELRQNPENDAVRLLLASELGRRGQFDKALPRLDEILSRDPKNLGALLNKAGILASARDWPSLRSTCAVVFALDPNSARCLMDMGYVDEDEGKLREAREKFARAYQVDPALSQALLHQGILEARMGDLSEAVRTLETAVERSPTAPAWTNLGSVYANRGEMKKAVQAFKTAVSVDPTFEPARRNLEIALADFR